MDPVEQDLRKILDFDVESLARVEDFGKTGFSDCISTAKKLQDFYRLLPVQIVPELPDHYRQVLLNRVQLDFECLTSFKTIPAIHHNPQTSHDLKRLLQERFVETLVALGPVFSYALLKMGDFSRFEGQWQARMDEVKAEAEGVSEKIAERSREIETVLRDAKEAAGIVAVSTQANFFEVEASEHAKLAGRWRITTFFMALLVIAAAAATLLLHKIPILEPKTQLDGYQLIASKVLLFAILSYMLVLCAKNFLAHKHNYVVNRHRRNALLSFRALSDAATDDKIRDVILTHASACIFTQQDTGYTKRGGVASSVDGKTIIGLIPGMGKGGD